MAADPKKVNPDLVRQEIEKGRTGEGVVWDEDQRQLVENQDISEIEKAERKRPA